MSHFEPSLELLNVMGMLERRAHTDPAAKLAAYFLRRLLVYVVHFEDCPAAKSTGDCNCGLVELVKD